MRNAMRVRRRVLTCSVCSEYNDCNDRIGWTIRAWGENGGQVEVQGIATGLRWGYGVGLSYPPERTAWEDDATNRCAGNPGYGSTKERGSAQMKLQGVKQDVRRQVRTVEGGWATSAYGRHWFVEAGRRAGSTGPSHFPRFI